MKTAKIAVYLNIALSIYNKEYTLICLKYICKVSLPFRRHGHLLRMRPYTS